MTNEFYELVHSTPVFSFYFLKHHQEPFMTTVTVEIRNKKALKILERVGRVALIRLQSGEDVGGEDQDFERNCKHFERSCVA